MSLAPASSCLLAGLLASFSSSGCASSPPPTSPAASAPVELSPAPPAAMSLPVSAVTPTAPTSAPPPATPPPFAPLADAPCRITRAHGVFSAIPLSWRGVAFASFERAEQVDLRITKDRATLALVTPDLEIAGDVDPSTIDAAPSEDALVEGFLRVRRARLDAVSGDHARLSAPLPPSVTVTRAPTVDVRCDALALGVRPPPPSRGKAVALRPGTTSALLRTPSGPTIGSVKGPAPAKPTDPFGLVVSEDVEELERKGQTARIRLVDHGAEVEGWISASALVPPPPVLAMLGALRGSGTSGKQMRCPQPVVLYLRDAGETVAIGRFRANGALVVARDGARAKAGEVAIELPRSSAGDVFADALAMPSGRAGMPPRPPGDVPRPPFPFVKTVDIAACQAATK